MPSPERGFEAMFRGRAEEADLEARPRDAITGRFVSREEATERPESTVSETVERDDA